MLEKCAVFLPDPRIITPYMLRASIDEEKGELFYSSNASRDRNFETAF